MLLVLAGLPQLMAQSTSQNKKALRFYEDARRYEGDRDFDKAIILYEKAVAADPSFAEAHQKLGVLYNVLRESGKARMHFEKAIELQPDNKAVSYAYFELGRILMAEGKYVEGDELLEKFLKYTPKGRLVVQTREALHQREVASFALEGMKNPVDFKPEELPAVVNAHIHQFFPVLTADQKTMFFTVYEEQEDIYESKFENGAWAEPKPIAELNTPYNEGTCTISADGRTMIFTACEGGASNRRILGSCDLFITYKTGDKWSEPQNLGPVVNSRSWESQPALSADGKTLFFSSDRAGGKGKQDIWVSKMDANGKWQRPVNLGDGVNTAGSDYSPFIHVNGQNLFFSSNGHQGFGKLDLFRSDLQEDGKWGKAQNLGYPLNNGGDQAALFITTDGKKGYYSDGVIKDGKRVADNIYVFDIPVQEGSPLKIEKSSDVVGGTVYDAKTKEKIGTKIDLVDLKTQEVVYSVSSDDENGRYSMVLTQGAEYALYVDKKGYLFKSLTFDYKEKSESQTIELDIYLDPIEKGTKVTLNNIFFASNSADLEEKSQSELNKLINFMAENNETRIEIGAHTDSQGSDAYNQDLSDKRAQAVVTYLKSKGMDPARVEWKGYGETQPVGDNATEEGRALNRRIEFKIL